MTENIVDILRDEKWLYFKLYKKPKDDHSWKSSLDWYHSVLREIVRPFVESTREVGAILFGIYGPTPYVVENHEKYERIITPPESDVVFMRLRAYISSDDKKAVKDKLVATIESRRDLVWDYEILKEYRVRDDLGGRFGRKSDGSIDDERTLRFIRYWDAGCRYILSILADEGNWEPNVDVWGIPHLINNSLGGWLRHPSLKCKNCGSLMYMATSCVPIPPQLLPALSSFKRAPIFLFVCPKCNSVIVGLTNI